MIINLINFLKFYTIITKRVIMVLFVKNRKLKKISFDYISYPHSDDDFLILDFNFTNALYFKINDVKYVYYGKKIIPLKKYNYKIEFTAIGIFKNYHETIVVEPTISTVFSNFKTISNNLQFSLEQQKELHFLNKEHKSISKNVNLNFQKITIKDNKPTFKSTKYNQNEFI